MLLLSRLEALAGEHREWVVSQVRGGVRILPRYPKQMADLHEGSEGQGLHLVGSWNGVFHDRNGASYPAPPHALTRQVGADSAGDDSLRLHGYPNRILPVGGTARRASGSRPVQLHLRDRVDAHLLCHPHQPIVSPAFQGLLDYSGHEEGGLYVEDYAPVHGTKRLLVEAKRVLGIPLHEDPHIPQTSTPSRMFGGSSNSRSRLALGSLLQSQR